MLKHQTFLCSDSGGQKSVIKTLLYCFCCHVFPWLTEGSCWLWPYKALSRGLPGGWACVLVSFIRSPILSLQGRVTWKWTPMSTLFICRFHRWTDSGPPRAWPCCDLVTEMTSFRELACSRPKKALGKPWKRLFPVPPPRDKVVKHLLGLLCSSLRKT